jgi:tripartite-type tricarboxylate transporter receptor subunit TctC
VAYAWLGVCAGAGIAASTVDFLNSRIGVIVNSADYRSLVEKSGSVAVSSTPHEFQGVIEQTAADAAPIFREYGIALD